MESQDKEDQFYNMITEITSRDILIQKQGLVDLTTYLRTTDDIVHEQDISDALIAASKKVSDRSNLYDFLSHFIVTNSSESLESSVFQYFDSSFLLKQLKGLDVHLIKLLVLYALFIVDDSEIAQQLCELYISDTAVELAEQLSYLSLGYKEDIIAALQDDGIFSRIFDRKNLERQVAAAELILSCGIQSQYYSQFRDIQQSYFGKTSKNEKKQMQKDFNSFVEEIKGRYETEIVQFGRQSINIESRVGMNKYNVIKQAIWDNQFNYWISNGQLIRSFLGLGEKPRELRFLERKEEKQELKQQRRK